jgi:glycosyltransferase involved in cell wall biosynthesis
MKKYGIYLAYPPTINLFGEGLGQHLMEFLKGAQAHGNVCFVIACPSWMREDLSRFFGVSNINSSCYEFIGPEKKPLFLSLYEKFKVIRNKTRKNRLRAYAYFIKKSLGALRLLLGRKLIAMRYTTLSIILGLMILPISLIVAVPLILILFIANTVRWSLIYFKLFLKKRLGGGKRVSKRVSTLTAQPKSDGVVVKLYQLLLEAETRLMLNNINLRNDIGAWYSPTVFWPSFNEIQAPKLTCVPDVVLSSFPIGFALIDEHNRYLHALKQVEKTIADGTHFVTYSDDVKWNTLVQRYHKNPSCISVVRHGANQLNDLIQVSGFSDNKLSTDVLSRSLFCTALKKTVLVDQVSTSYSIFAKNEVHFLFYASQCRPNKNIISLLRAYKYLLKERFLGLKLILTGDPKILPEISEYIREHNLMYDVLFLHRLTPQELAACYRLAELAVNPSFSEGGCPFTFTEALSVDTPVVMARIPVTDEVITCEELRELMLFDPYDWQDMANRIEWGLKNKEVLLQKQKPFYEKLAQRTWTHVVDDYINILEQISEPEKLNNNKLPIDPI